MNKLHKLVNTFVKRKIGSAYGPSLWRLGEFNKQNLKKKQKKKQKKKGQKIMLKKKRY